MALGWPVFQIAFWVFTPIFLIWLAASLYKEFKFWKLAVGFSAFTYLVAIALALERYGNDSTLILGVLIGSGIVALLAANWLRK